MPSAASASGSNAGLAAGLAGDGFLSVVRNGYANSAPRRHLSTCILHTKIIQDRNENVSKCMVFQSILGLSRTWTTPIELRDLYVAREREREREKKKMQKERQVDQQKKTDGRKESE